MEENSNLDKNIGGAQSVEKQDRIQVFHNILPSKKIEKTKNKNISEST